MCCINSVYAVLFHSEWQKLLQLSYLYFCVFNKDYTFESPLTVNVYFHFTGAALVLNSVYTVLREKESVVNEYWLELLYHMVVNLSLSEETDSILGSQEQVVTALNHIERVLKEKASLFNKVNIKTISSLLLLKIFPLYTF